MAFTCFNYIIITLFCFTISAFMHTTMPYLLFNCNSLSCLLGDRKHGNEFEKHQRSNRDWKAQCMLPSVAVQQLHVLCSQSWWSQTFSRRALNRTAALVCVSWPFFHILAGQMSVRLMTAAFRSVKMERLFPGLLVALCCQGSCAQHLSQKLLPANWRATVWKRLNS